MRLTFDLIVLTRYQVFSFGKGLDSILLLSLDLAQRPSHRLGLR